MNQVLILLKLNSMEPCLSQQRHNTTESGVNASKIKAYAYKSEHDQVNELSLGLP